MLNKFIFWQYHECDKKKLILIMQKSTLYIITLLKYNVTLKGQHSTNVFKDSLY